MGSKFAEQRVEVIRKCMQLASAEFQLFQSFVSHHKVDVKLLAPVLKLDRILGLAGLAGLKTLGALHHAAMHVVVMQGVFDPVNDDDVARLEHVGVGKRKRPLVF